MVQQNKKYKLQLPHTASAETLQSFVLRDIGRYVTIHSDRNLYTYLCPEPSSHAALPCFSMHHSAQCLWACNYLAGYFLTACEEHFSVELHSAMPPCRHLILWWHSWLCSHDVITAICTSLPALPMGRHVFHIQLCGVVPGSILYFFFSVLVSWLLFSLGPCFLYLLQFKWCWDCPASVHACQSCYWPLLIVKGELKFHLQMQKHLEQSSQESQE